MCFTNLSIIFHLLYTWLEMFCVIFSFHFSCIVTPTRTFLLTLICPPLFFGKFLPYLPSLPNLLLLFICSYSNPNPETLCTRLLSSRLEGLNWFCGDGLFKYLTELISHRSQRGTRFIRREVGSRR